MVSSIFLRNIRCFSEKRISFPSAPHTFIIGENGSGKTTILESILLPAYGFLYGVKASNFIKKGQTEASLLLKLIGETVRHEIKLRIRGGHRELFVDEKRRNTASLKELMIFSWFFPQDILLTLGPPEERRSYLDDTISRAYSSYKNLLNIYRKAIGQRNIALRNNATDREIDVYDQQIASTGARIIEKRLSEIDTLNGIFSKITEGLTGYRSSLRYYSKALRGEELESSLMEMLYVSRETDRKEGITSTGPHRDSVEIIFDERGSRNAASYGERKVISLALKLSQREYLERVSQKKVGFLADDLFSELDVRRRWLIMNYLAENEIYYIATATEKPVDYGISIEVIEASKDSVTSES